MTAQPLKKRPGFMLIELLLVLVILGLAVGILITAIGGMHSAPEEDLPVINPLLVEGVQQVRIAASRTTTINNLRQVMIAAHNAHDTYKKFPPHWGRYPSPMPNPGIPGMAADRTIYFHILPYVDGLHLYNTNNTTSPFPVYYSPLDPTTTDGTDGAGRGVASFLCNTLCFPPGPGYSRMPASFPAGTSNTVMFVTATANTTGGWHYWGGNPAQTAGVAQFVGNQPMVPLPLTNKMGPYQRGAQLTPHGFQVVMGDGSTRSVWPGISPAVWQAVTNPMNFNPVPVDWDQR
jgi:hypothetical protein